MDNTVAADTPAVRLNRSARREAILKGAAKAFVRQGYDATSLEDISEAAGISRALLYRHFDSKEAIYRAILDSTMERIRDGQVVTPGTGFGNKLEQLIEVASVYPDGFVLVFRHAVREPAFKEQAGANHLLRQKFIESNLSKIIPNSKRRQFAASLLRDTLIGTLLTWIDSGQPEPERVPDLLSTMAQSIIQAMSDNSK